MSTLPAGEVHAVTEHTFDLAADSDGTTVVEFWAQWCGPCQMMGPVFEDIARSRPALRFLKVDLATGGDLPVRFGVQSVPTILVLQDGRIRDALIGARPKQDVLARIDAVVGASQA